MTGPEDPDILRLNVLTGREWQWKCGFQNFIHQM